MFASLVGFLGDFDLAEEAAQEAFAVATERWPRDGIPANPGAWLTVTARNWAIDRIRRDRTLREKARQLEVPEAGRGAATARSGGVSIATGAARLVSKSRDGEKHESAPQSSPVATSVAASGAKTDAVQRTLAEREGAEPRPPSETDAETASMRERSPEPSPEYAPRHIARDRAPAGAGSGGGDSHGSAGGAATTERRIADPGARASRTGAASIGASGMASIDPQERNGGGSPFTSSTRLSQPSSIARNSRTSSAGKRALRTSTCRMARTYAVASIPPRPRSSSSFAMSPGGMRSMALSFTYRRSDSSKR